MVSQCVVFFNVVLICNFLVTNDVEHFFMCLLVICISSLKKCLFKSFGHFKMDYLSFHCWLMSFLHSLDTATHQTWYASNFSYFVNSLSLSWWCPLKHNILKFWWRPVYLFFPFVACAIGVIWTNKSLLNQGHENLLLFFF